MRHFRGERETQREISCVYTCTSFFNELMWTRVGSELRLKRVRVRRVCYFCKGVQRVFCSYAVYGCSSSSMVGGC